MIVNSLVFHSSVSDNWWTPDWLVNLSKEVLGEIDLDPASSYESNLKIGAARFIDEKSNGLITPWNDNENEPISVFLNPPGGKIGNKSKAGFFWNTLMAYASADFISHAIFLAFSIEALQTTQINSSQPITSFPLCIPKKRIAFVDPINNARHSPSHSNAIAYIPGTKDESQKFIDVFQDVGAIMMPLKKESSVRGKNILSPQLSQNLYPP